jgi:hypothetical protein
MADPSLEVCPDFAGDLYASICEDLIAATGAGAQEVVDRLVGTWTEGHNVLQRHCCSMDGRHHHICT